MPRWRTRVGTLLVVPLLATLAACGSDSAPAKLEPVQPAVPDNVCALLPENVTKGLQSASSTDPSGDPTAACSLSSAPAATPVVRSVVTITQYNDEASAQDVYDSQCRALDATQGTVNRALAVPGADKACSLLVRGADVSTLAALRGRDVLTARASSQPAGSPDAVSRGTQMLQAVIAGASASPSPAG
jgi:hypothetical protein